MKLKFTFILLFFISITYSQIPSYYNDVDLTKTGIALKDELSTKTINSHVNNLSYTPGVWNALEQTDLDPTDVTNSNVLLLYGHDDADANVTTDRTRNKTQRGGNVGDWNREHVFARSLGVPNLGTSGPGSDAHHLRSCDFQRNSTRNNRQFADGSGISSFITSSGYWYPGDEWKGDVARMVLYMYLRYGAQCNPSFVAVGTTNAIDNNMIDLLLDWNAEDPVSEYETNRNTILETLQGNRNPFIDNPIFATTIWGGQQAEDKFSSLVDNCSDLFISEYIEGTSSNKYLELYNPTNTIIDLSSYDLVIYQNGSSSVSGTLTLTGNINAHDTFVIENSGETIGFASDLSTSNIVMSFTGDDVIALRKSSTIIDVIGQIGTDPGSQWVGTVCLTGTEDAVLRRSYATTVGDNDGSNTFDLDESWICSATDDITNLGMHTNSCAVNEIDIQGSGISIANNETLTSILNNTDFGAANTSSESIIKTYTIKNDGGSTLTLSGNPVLSGTNSSDFNVTINPTLSIAGFSSTSFSVTFDPSSDGIKTATITIGNDDSDENPYAFSIQGTGTSSSDCSDLFISEYIEGSSNNKYLELYNPSAAAIDLSSYDLVIYQNGSSSVSGTLTLSGSINSYETFVIEKSTESLSVAADLSTGSSVLTFNGNDVIALRKSGIIIDVIGEIANDPGTQWAGTCGTQNTTLRRKLTIKAGDDDGFDSYTADTEWDCSSIDDVSDLGSHTNTCFPEAEIDIQGNDASIANGSSVVSISNDTDFGTLNSLTGSVVKTFTIINDGNIDLILTNNPTITGSSDFSITSNPTSLVILPTNSVTFDVTFNPSSDTDITAEINVLSNDLDESPYIFSIKGAGTSGAIPCTIINGTTIGQQNFENTPAIPNLTYTSTGTAISNGDGSFPSAPLYVDGSQGLVVNNASASIEFDADVSSYSNIDFSIRLASFAGTNGNGNDTGDYVKVSVSTDGLTYSEELEVLGNNNAKWSFTSGTGAALASYDGDNTVTTFQPAGGGNRTTDGYTTLSITGLPISSTLKIKIELLNNSANEFWVLDSAKIIGDGALSSSWDGSWSNGVPNETMKAIFNSDYDMNTKLSITTCECEVKNTGSITVSENKYLKVENDIVNNGTITIEDSGSLLQVSDVASNSGTGEYIVKRNTANLPSKNAFTFWTSPLTSSTLAEITANASSYFSFNAANQTWVVANANTLITPGSAFAVQGPDVGVTYPGIYTAEFTGSSFNTGDISVVLDYSDDAEADNDWNLIGNPYPSTLDAATLLSLNPALGGTIYFWTQLSSQGDYVSWNATGGTASCAGCVAPTGNIASSQGFFVQAMSSSSITFTNNMRIAENNDNFYRTDNSKEEDKIWLNLSSNNSFNQILIGFLENATDGIDRLYDGEKIDGGTNASFYSLIEEKEFVIQGRKPLKGVEEIPLGFSTNVAENFTISIDDLRGNLYDSAIYIKDDILNVVHNLNDSDYTFTVTEKDVFNNRFKLILETSSKTLDVENIESITKLIFENSTENIIIKTNNGSLINRVFVYDILGKQKLFKKGLSSKVELESIKIKPNSILIVKTELETGEIIISKIYKN